MNITAQQIISALHNMTEDELMLINKSLIGIARAKRKSPNSERAIVSAVAKAHFNIGDQVEWNSTKENRVIKGVISKINPKYVKVKPDDGLPNQMWNVPPLMLRKC